LALNNIERSRYKIRGLFFFYLAVDSANFYLPLFVNFVIIIEKASIFWPKTHFVAKNFRKTATYFDVDTLEICALAKNPLFSLS
jgi:hypothetical protein